MARQTRSLLVRTRARWIALACVIGLFASVAPARADGWDYVYGDPGPANYSRYQAVKLAPDGSTFIAGFYSGTFNGLSSPDAYRYFIQHVNVDGTVAWTKELATGPLPTQSIPFTPDLTVDGLGNPFVGVADTWFAYSSSGSVVSSMAVPCCWGYPQRTPPLTPVATGGFVAIVNASAPKLQQRNANLGLVWETDLSTLIDPPTVCAFCGGVIPDVTAVSDGTFWVIGRKTRTLVTQQDAMAMVHVSATGAQIVTVKHFGLIPAPNVSPGVGPILASSDSFIWVAVNAGSVAKVVSFAPSDGHVLGDVSTLLPAEDISTPDGIVNFGGLDFNRISDSTAGTLSGGVEKRRILLNGSRLVVVARCGSTNSRACGTPGVSAASATVLLSYSVGPLGGGLSLLASRALSSTTSVYAMDADGAGNAVVAGSTTGGVVYAGPIARSVPGTEATSGNEQAVAARNPLGNLNTVGEYKGVTPTRLFDTRSTEGNGAVVVAKTKIGGTTTLAVKVAGKLGVPANGAGAVSLNVTVVDPDAAGYLTVYPCGTPPTASNLNFVAGQTVANAVIAPLSANGEICFASNAPTNVLADVNGWFRAGLGFTAVAPLRVFDTRPGSPHGAVPVEQRVYGGASELKVKVAGVGGVPLTNFGAVSLNVTVVGPAGPGFVTVYPCGTRPNASNLNFVAGQIVPNAVIAPVSPNGEVCLYSSVDTHLLADVNGWFATGSSFNALTPVRVVDTRPTEGQGAVPVAKQKYGPGALLKFTIAGAGGVPATGAGAVALNVTVVDPDGAGFVTVFPCGAQPLASNVNFTAGQTVPNAVLVPISPSGEICFAANTPAHILVDVNGWIRAS